MADPDRFYNLLKDLFLILDDGDRTLLLRYRLTVPRYYALVHIGEEPGLSSSQLSDLMLCDKSNISRIIKGMEADGLVTRRAHESDGRAARLYLSSRGQALCEQAQLAHTAYNRRRFRCISEIQQENLLDGLLQLKQGLREQLAPLKDTDDPKSLS
jgi:DNA-binding MarR family transcriptional regulator